ncbi:MAG: radical SAM family heme chaperone HemW [Pseudomonadota bacterium]
MADPAPWGVHRGFGAYLHWPFCAKICPYCDFNVYAAKDRNTEPLLAAMLTDIRRQADRLTGHPPLQSIYFGGGTPSLLTGAEIRRFVDGLERAFGLAPEPEITLEANPNAITKDHVAAWRAAGINRLSVGVQSLNDEALTFLGRDHDAQTARRAIETAVGAFPKISIDLMYARPGQTLNAWREELREAIGLGARHVSLYELTIEPATPFGKAAARGQLLPMPDDDQADLYELTNEIMTAHGLPAYEISNHAAEESDRSRHNLVYWRSGDWLGIGPGAHGRITRGPARAATFALRRPGDYIAAVEASDAFPGTTEPLSQLDAATEWLTMGLRTDEGLDSQGVRAAFGTALTAPQLDQFVENGWVRVANGRIALTPDGRLLADQISARLLEHLTESAADNGP